jgi:hypothetical protein
MTARMDIIGVVKELQAMDARTFSPAESGEREHHWRRYETMLRRHFPQIARSLLIAVGTLEQIVTDNEKQRTVCRDYRHAKQALARIRSLKP